jgi:large subunit ribosomal protein L18
MLDKQKKRERRHKRVRAKIKGTATCPRLSVFRSNKHVVLQLIDDEKNKSLLQMSDLKIIQKKKITKAEKAYELGKKLAEAAKKKKIKKAVFDRGGYAYHGRVKAVAEGARKGGLIM